MELVVVLMLLVKEAEWEHVQSTTFALDANERDLLVLVVMAVVKRAEVELGFQYARPKISFDLQVVAAANAKLVKRDSEDWFAPLTSLSSLSSFLLVENDVGPPAPAPDGRE